MASLLSYDSITTSFLGYLQNNLYTINSGYNEEVQTLGIFEPSEVNIWASRFPAISINLKDTDEVKGSMNSYTLTNDNTAKFNFEIGCHIRDIKSYTCVILNMQRFAAQVANVIRSDMTASSTFNMVTVDEVVFNTTIKDKNNLYQKNAVINISAYKYF